MTRARRHGHRVDRRRGAHPPSGDEPTLYTFDWGAPALPNAVDGAAVYTLGVKFQTAEALPCIGVQWHSTLTAPTGSMAFTLWGVTGQNILATASATIDPVEDVGQLLNVLFDDPVALAVGVDYMATFHTEDLAPTRYCVTTTYPWPQTDGPLVADAVNGWFVAWNDEVFPNNASGNTANYHVSPILSST